MLSRMFLAFLLLTGTVCVPEQPNDKENAIRKDFIECQTRHWKGTAWAFFYQDIDLNQQQGKIIFSYAKVYLNCPAYIKWWSKESYRSPFSFKMNEKDSYHEIPPSEWMFALDRLQKLNAE